MIQLNLIGKSLIFFGAVLVAAGLIFLLAGRFHWIGRLPGDILIRKKSFTFFFPVTTSIVVSVVLTLIFYLSGRK